MNRTQQQALREPSEKSSTRTSAGAVRAALPAPVARSQTWVQDTRSTLGQRDALTALPNATLFKRRITQALLNAVQARKPMAIITVCLSDGMQGKEAFDPAATRTVLATYAARLGRAFHAHTILSRSAMYEFTCGVADMSGDAEFASELQALHAELAKPIAIAGAPVSIRPCIGVAICPFDGLTGESLSKRSSAAAHVASRNPSGIEYFGEQGD